ncbi:clan AA aspartic protease [Rhodoplanes serenus]|uniref:Clan AA aspartic protease n=1 Tax=Rhodoplanes serenus TaxID=200615 RepID=A0A327JZQ7_9BRAD|nr:clan AA aspartic protease [Rhodoplanes serenus]MTW18110.1 clan AA aspartic protease [Rhodoplanes serenus]RAI31979.1 clan AA aspartic protease [Rhodoplanes serenus]
MGLVSVQVRLENVRRPDLAPVEAPALADTGALHLCVPEHVALQLGLDEFDRREVTLADGSRRLVSYVGPLLVTVANRKGLAGAMVLGTEILLGAIPMEDLDLVVVPGTRQVIPNPANPNIAVSIAKGVRG